MFNLFLRRAFLNHCACTRVSNKTWHRQYSVLLGEKHYNKQLEERQCCKLFQDDFMHWKIHLLPFSTHKTEPLHAEQIQPFLARIVVNRELHKGGNRSCMHIELDIEGSNMQYDPGDYIAIYPTNDAQSLSDLKPRYYSISSSSKLHPNHVHITAVLVDQGVVTNSLKLNALNENASVPVFISKSQFRLPIQSETPIIMVGTGTGLAPFRGFIQERQHLRNVGKSVGKTILYFGCRKQSEDFIYSEELEEYVKNGTLVLKTAFSRNQAEKIYVTNFLKQDMDLIWNVIGENRGHFYICGNKIMSVNIRDILVKTISEKGSMSETEAIDFLQKMEHEKRYSAEVWN